MSHLASGTSGAAGNLLPPDLALDAQGRLMDEVHCRVCGYNLRGADPNGACSECGTAVGWSVVGDLLRFSPPDWMRKVARGATLIVAGIATLIITGLVALILVFVSEMLAGIVAILATLAAIGMLIAGVWYITTPEPAKQDQETGLNARKLTRYTLIPGYLLSFVSTGLGAMAANMTMANIANGLDMVSTLLSIVGFFAYFVFLRQLALRVPDDKLASQTRTVMWGIVVGYGLIFVGGLMALLTGGVTAAGPGAAPAPGAASMGLFAILGCVAAVAILVFGLWSLILIDRYRRTLREAADQAESTWAARG